MPLQSTPVSGDSDAGFAVKRLGVRRDTFAAAAVVLALLAAGGVLAFAVSAGAVPQSALQETTVSSPTDTGPTPDPAPAPKPTPKPKSAPTRHRTYTTHRTYNAPTRTYSTRANTPPRAATHSSKPKPATTDKNKRPAKKAVVTTSTPAETTPAPATLVPVGSKQARSSPNSDRAITSILFIAGVTFAGLLFLLAAAVPGTPARFTSVGRVVFEHQQDLVLVGVASFVITVFVYVLTGHGL